MKPVKNVALVGFGSLGAMYAACFGRAMGAEAMAVVADEARTATYRAQPTLFNGEPIQATYLTWEEAAARGPFDVVVLAVKYGSLEEAAAQSAPLIGPDTAIISVLNGVTSEEVLAASYGWDRTLLAVAQQMDSRKIGHEVTCRDVGVLALGVHDPQDPVQQSLLDRITRWLDEIGQPYITPEDIQHQLWGKLICNVGVNQACAVYDCCFDGIHAEGEAREAMKAAMGEVVAVGRACGIALTDEDYRFWLDVIDHLNPAAMPSLRQDVLARRLTEVDLFAGTINRLGREHNVPTPQNEKFYEAIKAIEASY